MATYSSLLVHVVFSTKDRLPLIPPHVSARLCEYISSTYKGLGAQPLGSGGTEDHVHSLIGTRPSQKVSDLFREVKKASNAWMRSEMLVSNFEWQDGYGAFSVSGSQRRVVEAYVASQWEHHQLVDSRTELLRLLEEEGIEFDERFFA